LRNISYWFEINPYRRTKSLCSRLPLSGMSTMPRITAPGLAFLL
jgi:hypothetical protein